MPRPSRRGPGRRTAPLSAGILAFLRGKPAPERDGPDRDDYNGLEYFGNVVRAGRLIPLEHIRQQYADLIDDDEAGF